MIRKAVVLRFGCQLNFADAEKIEGILVSRGIEIVKEPEDADIVFLCTCAVRESAENRIWGQIGELSHIKEKRPDFLIALCGCMANEDVTIKKIKRSYPQVDLVFGTGSLAKLPAMLAKVENGGKFYADYAEYLKDDTEAMPVRESKFRALVPVTYGCNNFCTYCIVPHTRGRERSRDPHVIINEVEKLVDFGYKEIFLLGQNVNSYGKDFDTPYPFAKLLDRIEQIDGDFRIRFLSSHPKDVSPELMDIVKSGKKTEAHFHLPLQSGDDRVLKRMNRHYDIERYMSLVDYLRNGDSGFSITTDIIVGFPNETEEEFEHTLDIVKQVKYDNIFSFIYSKRSGTPAAKFEDKISREEKGARMQEMLKIQREITSESYKRFVGKTYRVLCDGVAKKGGMMTGKNSAGIIVEFPGNTSMTGKFLNVKINDSANWAIKGEIV